MITERTLRRWRKEALVQTNWRRSPTETFSTDCATWTELNERILRLTQELLDQYLLRKGKS